MLPCGEVNMWLAFLFEIAGLFLLWNMKRSNINNSVYTFKFGKLFCNSKYFYLYGFI